MLLYIQISPNQPTMDDPFARFTQLHKNSIASSSTQPPIAYTGVTVRTDTKDLEERLSKIKFNNIPELPAEFGDIPDIITYTSKSDFPDDSWRHHEALILRSLPDVNVIQLGRELFRTLSFGVSQYHAGLIFSLAFQLKRPGSGKTARLMPDSDSLAMLADIEIDILDKTVDESSGTSIEPTEYGDSYQIAQGYSYLAASMLKLFARSAENYEKSWSHIVDGYRKFYSDNCPISGVRPQTDVIKRIHDHFSISELMKATLYRFLYNANRDGDVESLQRYLYDIHLSHTGMHVVPIAYEICMVMNCTPSTLLTVMYANRFRPQITGLMEAFKLMKNTDENHKRQMWKYGRIFDSDFLASLQTRRCPKFVYSMACILLRESPKYHAGILGIKQLEEVGQEDQNRLLAEAKTLIDAIKSKNLESRKS